jgi:hypothetical protein
MNLIHPLRRLYLTSQRKLTEERRARRSVDRQLHEMKRQLAAARELHSQEMERAKAEITALEKKHEEELKEFETLAQESQQLKRELEVKEPLYQVGLDVRLRFLEYARESISGVDPRNLDQGVIARGYNATHRGRGEADNAALSCLRGAVPTAHLDALFIDLYHCPTSRYLNWTEPKLRQALNYQASIRTLTIQNHSLNRPIRERQSAMEHFQFIWETYERFRGSFQSIGDATRSEIERRLVILKELTARILIADRLNKGIV